MLKFIFQILFFTFLFVISLSAKPEINVKEGPKDLKDEYQQEVEAEKNTFQGKELSLIEIVDIVLKNNEIVTQQALDVIKSDTEYLKNDSQYATTLETGLTYNKIKNKYTNSFTTGDTVDIANSYLKLKKLFSSGTYFEVGITDTDLKGNQPVSSLFTDAVNNTPGTSIFSPRNLHTTGLSLVLRQELMKNAFGYNQRRTLENLREKKDYLIETLTYQLGNIVVQTLISYWQLKIADEIVRTNERLLNNLLNIRNITQRKANLGLSEVFEITQWNALIITTKNSVKQAKLRSTAQERDLLRLMNLKQGTPIKGVVQLIRQKPNDINIAKDIDIAYNTRPDLRAIIYQKMAAKRNLEIAKNNLLPSLSVGVSANGQGFDESFPNAFRNSYTFIYPNYGVNFKLEYPFDDPAPKTDARNALIDLEKLEVKERELRRQISDDIYQGFDEIQVSYDSVLESQKALDANKSYYAGLLNRFRQGRFNSTFIKNALDAIIQSENTLTQSLVNYNIALVRYDLARNMLFTKYKVDIKGLFDKFQFLLGTKPK